MNNYSPFVTNFNVFCNKTFMASPSPMLACPRLPPSSSVITSQQATIETNLNLMFSYLNETLTFEADLQRCIRL